MRLGPGQRWVSLDAEEHYSVQPPGFVWAGTARLGPLPLDGTDHASHKEQASTIRRYIIWRNNHAYDERLRRIVAKANVALCGSRSRRRRWPGVCGGLCRWTGRPPHAGPHGPGWAPPMGLAHSLPRP